MSRRHRMDVNTKLRLPKDLNNKLFGALLKDLGCEPGHAKADVIPDLSDDTLIKDIRFANQIRDNKKMADLVAGLQPQCMLEHVTRADEFFARYCLGSFLRKFPAKGTDSRTNAIKKFHETERSCATFNTENFKALVRLSEDHPDFRGVIEEIRKDIRELLDEQPRLDLVYRLGKHGPGTSFLGKLYRRGKTTSFFKWSNLPYTATRACVPYAKEAILSDDRWIGALDDDYRRRNNIPVHQPLDMSEFWDDIIEVVENSRTTTVPKSAEIDRTICIEPLLNVFLQLGVDGFIRSRLKSRWQYDINTQELNQELAKQGSIDGSYATIDLAAASDSISLKICEMFLPAPWYDLLYDLRCAVTDIDGELVTLEKISSMGNGFTFALETLIFGAVTRLAIRRSNSVFSSAVFGDDIVIPTTAKNYLFDMLSLCGFRINTDKSFWYGPFRESCGKDFFKGTFIRPVFLKRPLLNITDLLYLHNRLFELEDELDWFMGYTFENTRTLIRRYLPNWVKRDCLGPPSQNLDSYLFSRRRFVIKDGYATALCIQAVAKKVKRRYKNFFFVKLMHQLKGRRPENIWDRKRSMNSSSAFDIVLSRQVSFTLTKRRIFLTDSC